MLGCAYTICLYGRIEISCTFPSGSPCRPSRVSPYTPSVLICFIRLLCVWLFRLCHRIAYIYCFVASYLFSLWYYYYYYYYYFPPWEFITPSFASGLPQEPEWQQVSSDLFFSSVHFSQSQQCCGLDASFLLLVSNYSRLFSKTLARLKTY